MLLALNILSSLSFFISAVFIFSGVDGHSIDTLYVNSRSGGGVVEVSGDDGEWRWQQRINLWQWFRWYMTMTGSWEQKSFHRDLWTSIFTMIGLDSQWLVYWWYMIVLMVAKTMMTLSNEDKETKIKIFGKFGCSQGRQLEVRVDQ